MKILRLAAFATALWASAAQAGAVAVVVAAVSNVNQQALSQQEQAVLGILRTYGVDYDLYYANGQGLRTEWCRTGTFQSSMTGTLKSYKAVFHLNYAQSAYTNLLGFYCPESLLRAARWPTVPQVYVSVPAALNNHFGTAGSTDSLSGVKGPGAASETFKWTHVMYRPGTPLRWRNVWGGMFYVVRSGSPAGIFRPLIGYGISASMDGGFRACISCDSTTQSAFPDTLLMWARYRSSLEPAPQIMLYPSYSATSGAYGMVAMALAMADSAAGGQIIPQRGPKTLSIVVSGAFSRGSYKGYASAGAGGTFCYADSCDSAHVKAGIDSLGTLRQGGQPVPIVVAANLDSVAAYPYELAWWSRLPNVRYVPTSKTAVVSGMSGTNASKYRLVDMLGARRARTIFPIGADSLNAACSAGDSSIKCLVKAAYARAESLWSGKVDHVLYATESDYLPPSITAKEGANLDYLHYALYQVGLRGFVIQPQTVNSSPGANWYVTATLPGGATSTAATNPSAWTPAAGSVPVWKTPGAPGGTRLGSLRQLASRYYMAPEANVDFTVPHDYHLEVLWGRLTGQWYLTRLNNYTHFFDTSLSVFETTAGKLGGWGATVASNVPRLGYWHAKWLVNEAEAINSFCYPGRPMLRFVALEDNQP